MTTTTTYNQDGSYTVYTTDSAGDTTTQNYSAAGVLQSDTWTQANGSSGGDTYNADGSSSGYTDNPDGSTSAYVNDGQGDVTTTNYNASGVATGDSWTEANGASGSDTFNPDGSIASSTVNLGEASQSVSYGNQNVTLTAGDGNDSITLGSGTGSVTVGNGSDSIVGAGSLDASAGDGNDYLQGGAGASQLSAGNGNDTLVAGSGVATLTGGSGTDVFVVDNAADVVTVAENQNQDVEETSVSATLAANVRNMVATGSAAITLTGTSEAAMLAGGMMINQSLTANSGNDTLVAGYGVTTMNGGAGNDTFVVADSRDVINALPGTSAVVLTPVSYLLPANVQVLTGTGSANVWLEGNSLNDTITGNGAADILQGGSGNATLISGTGVDTFEGGSGNDTFVVNNVSDVIEESANTGNNLEESSVSATLAANVQNLTGIGSAAVALTGNSLANVITGNAGNDTLIAGSGLATLDGGSGNNLFEIDNPSDVIVAPAGHSNVEYSSVSTVMATNVQWLQGTGTAALTLTGGNQSGNYFALVEANSGNDTLISGAYATTLVGGSGNDVFEVNNSQDQVDVAASNAGATVQSSVSFTQPANTSALYGVGSANISLGAAYTGNDTIVGNTGTDTLMAGSGNDTLILNGPGVIYGGTGSDTFILNGQNDAVNAQAGGTNTVLTAGSVNIGQYVQSLTGTGSANLSLQDGSTNAVITSNSGVDTLSGGSSNDTYVVNNASDTVYAQLNYVNGVPANVNTVDTSVNYVLPADVQNITAIGSANVTLSANNNLNNVITSNSGVDTLIGGAGNETYVVNNAQDLVLPTEMYPGTAQANVNTVDTSVSFVLPNNLQILTGIGSANIVLQGNSGNDTITSNSGADSLAAGSGNDTLIINNSADMVANPNNGNATLLSSVSYSLANANNFNNLTLTGSGSLTATAGYGNDLLVGNSGADTLTGGSGTDVLQAGAGADMLNDNSGGNGVLVAGAGSDTLLGGGNNQFFAAGAGTDTIALNSGEAVVGYNNGDGKTTIYASNATKDVLSLGGGTSYSNLSFSKSGNNLVLNTGNGNAITFSNWYGGSQYQDFVTLQVLEQTASTYSPSSTNPLYNQEVEEFNFTQLVSQFNSALAAQPTLTSWSLSNGLLSAHLSGSNTAAYGGDLAYYDGVNGNLTGMTMAAADSAVQNTNFGKTTQTIDAWSGISGGNATKLH